MSPKKVCTYCVPVVVAAGLLFWTRSSASDPPGGGGGTGPDPEPGTPRHWEPGLEVNDYSVFNLSNGNLLTVLPLVAWDPVGPPIGFTLYHNSDSVNQGESGAAGVGFDLGPGWSVSYSGRIEPDPNDPNAAIVIEDDATRNVFTLSGSRYVPPAGVYDRLERVQDPQTQEWSWVLTRPNQWRRIFDANGGNLDGLLVEEKDSSGNTVTIHRHANGRIDRAASAVAGGYNDLEFEYDGSDRLDYIRDPISRYWYFEYNDADRVISVRYFNRQDGLTTSFTYNDDGLVVTVSARDGLTWTYGYDQHGVLTGVTDPNGADPNTPPYHQGLRTVITMGGGDHAWKRELRDRRGYWWAYCFDEEGNLVKRKDPLDHFRYYTHDENHNLLTFKDELNHTWTATYGPVGNLETLTSPLPEDPQTQELQTWTLTWEAVGDPQTTNFYRLTQIADPADKWVQFQYADPSEPNDPNDPTLVTRVIEMPDGQGEPNAVTQIKYYDSPSARGQVRKVIDANGVKTQYTYEGRGYLSAYQEGFAEPPQGVPHYPVWYGTVHYDAVGRPEYREWYDSGWVYHICQAYWDEFNNSTGADGGSAPVDRLGSPPSPDIWPAWPTVGGPDWGDVAYTEMGLLKELHIGTDPAHYLTALARDLEPERRYQLEYDEFRNLAEVSIESGQHGLDPKVERVLEFPDYDPEGRLLEEHGPDGETSTYTYTARGELQTVTRDEMSATLTYDAAGRLTQVDYSNGMREVREYDEADRLTEIRHEDALEAVLWAVTYDWTINNWLEGRTEYDGTVDPAVTALVSFFYDNRGRLIAEERSEDNEPTYDLSYTYDQLGNRLFKVDSISGRVVEYTYDTQLEPVDMDYATRNNRLLEYQVYEPDPGDPQTLRLLRTVSYTYYKTGDASNITIKDEYLDAQTTPGDPDDYDWHHDLALYYDMGHKLRIGLWDRWKDEDGNGQADPGTYEHSAAREFRYDPLLGPRARYAAVDYDTGDEQEPNAWTIAEPIGWTDYDSLLPYQDLELTGDGQGGYDVTAVRRYLGTAADEPLDANGQPLDTRYYHQDLIGSTWLLSDGGGAAVSGVEYTAFGEVLDADGAPGGTPPQGFPRYQYAGRHGYESGLLALQGVNPNLAPITLQHVGWRWYQPDIGRFTQRDPIGIRGGLNVYAYVANQATAAVDPLGLVCDICGAVAGHRPGCPLYPKPPKGWKPKPKPPPPPLTPRQELERLKKRIYIRDGLITLGGIIVTPFCPLAGAGIIGGVLASHIADECVHMGEGLNPVHGGDYDTSD